MGQRTVTHDPCDPSKIVTHLTHWPTTHCLLCWKANRNSHAIYWMLPFRITLSDLEWLSEISRGFSATAELFVLDSGSTKTQKITDFTDLMPVQGVTRANLCTVYASLIIWNLQTQRCLRWHFIHLYMLYWLYMCKTVPFWTAECSACSSSESIFR